MSLQAKFSHVLLQLLLNPNLPQFRLHYIRSLGAFAKSRKTTVRFVMSVCISVRPSLCPSARKTLLPLKGLRPNLVWGFFGKSVKKIKCHSNITRITGTLHTDVITFMTISRWIPLRMRNVLDKIFRGHKNVYVFSNSVSKIMPFMR
jgi:hypothetical protein